MQASISHENGSGSFFSIDDIMLLALASIWFLKIMPIPTTSTNKYHLVCYPLLIHVFKNRVKFELKKLPFKKMFMLLKFD